MTCQSLCTYMETGRVIFLPQRAIQPNPAQPRKAFTEENLQELAQSIREHGILQPLLVRRAREHYELIAGERRLRAARIAGLSEIPCIVMTMDEKESGLAAMIENLQRQDLNFREEALGIRFLVDRYAMSQEQTARMLGMSQSAVANKLRLLRLPPQILDQLCAAGLSERHARALLSLPEAALQEKAAGEMIRRHMSVQESESYIRTLLLPARSRQGSPGNALRLLRQTLRRIQAFEIGAVSHQRETDREIVFTITVPK